MGTVSANPTSPDGFYNSGTSVQLTAAAITGNVFSSWTGDLTGTANPQSVVMSAPRAVTANFGTAPVTTITTSPTGLQIVVDGTTLTAPQTFVWTAGSSHSISSTSPQGTGDTRQVFANWSDGGAQAHTITGPGASATYTANFTTQYRLTTAVSPAGSGTIATNPASPDGFFAAGASVQLTATAAGGYVFSSWSGDLTNTTNPQSLVMSAPRSVTANFLPPSTTTVTTNPAGLQVVVDGVTLVAPQNFSWTAGSNHTINAVSPQGSGDTRQVFATWSDGGAQTHTITASGAGTTFTANFTTQYRLTSAVSPAGSGILTANPPSSDGFYAAGTSVQLTVTGTGGYQFAGWSGDLSGSANPQSVTMDAPRSVTANCTTPAITVVVSPATATLTAGQTLQFTAKVSGTGNAAVVWKVSAGVGTIGADGIYTAPAAVTGTQTATITATSVADPSKSGTATVTVSGAPSAELTIQKPSLPDGTVGAVYPSAVFGAQGGTAPYTWSATGVPGGMSLGADGTLAGTPTTAGAFSMGVTVTDAAGNTGTQSFTVAIKLPAITASPNSLTFTYRQGDPVPAAQTVSVFGTGAALAFSTAPAVDAGGDWLAASQQGAQTPSEVSVSLKNVDKLAAGSYTGRVTVTPANGTAAVVPVTLVVEAAPPKPQLSLAPTALTLNVEQGSGSVLNQFVVSNTGSGQLSFQASAGCSWVTAGQQRRDGGRRKVTGGPADDYPHGLFARHILL